ncbi:hypothetical protein BHE74_00030674 [Ensete ventricosum]|nr:hypothetical protein BHE74_00030674 [Ensete ventricosum]
MDAKKKKNKKKKGNQNKVAEDATSNSEKVAVQESNNGSRLEENCNSHTSTNIHIQNVGVSESDMEHDKNKIYEENFAFLEEKLKNVESIKDSLVLAEMSLKERIARVEEASTALDTQVNEPYTVPEKHGGYPSGTDLNNVEMLDRPSSPSHYVSEFEEKIKDLGETVQPSVELQENFGANNGINDMDSETVDQPGTPPSDEPSTSEPATVPFDEIQIHKEDLTGVKNNEIAEAIPLSDAPLIGAPFRLISFMAKYVSGADLVKQNSSRSGH